VRRVIYTAALYLTVLAPALADVRILASPGGEVVPFLKLFAALNESGERIIIDGPCLSACTLVLSEIPNNRICVTPNAVLGFHAALLMDENGRKFPAAYATRLLAATYPMAVRDWINRHGGLTQRLILLHGRDLAALYPHCS
jgi:hypothetical protein